MVTQKENANTFRSLHQKGSPVILFNIWDAGSARAIKEAGAKAIATGSWGVAAAYGFDDGQKIPLELVLKNLERIVASVALPVTLDFEGGYATDPQELKENIRKVIAAGAVGINFEDRIVGGDGLHAVEDQCARIEAIHEVAAETSVPLFINARTDIFLRLERAKHSAQQLEEALLRAAAYAKAGATGLFAPGLIDLTLIKELCDRSPLPVNILMLADIAPVKTLAQQGVARISYGSGPYRRMIEEFKEAGRKAFAEA
jgi:2-methylisocitrate lyase-like PEP mutase family enzyme